MKNFHKIASGTDVIPLVHAILRRPYLWAVKPVPNEGVMEDIWLRYSNLARLDETGRVESLDSELECLDLPEFAVLPQARKLVFDLMQRVEGERLGRITVLRLPRDAALEYEAGEQSPYAEYYSPYVACLQSMVAQGQAGMKCSFLEMGEEAHGLMSGDVFWFDHRSPYKLVNESPEDLILMRIDVRVAA